MAQDKGIISIVRQTAHEFTEDDCASMAAALAYYTIFSLPALLVIVIAVAGFWWGQEAVEGRIQRQLSGLLGSAAAAQIQTMVRSATAHASGGMTAVLLGMGALLISATTAFAQLQAALNRAWQVAPDPEAGGVKNFFTKRLVSFGIILVLAFLLLVSLLLSAALSTAGDLAGSYLGTGSETFIQAIHFALNLGIITLLFAAIFRILPDAEIEWGNVWVGAALTALLFTLGKSLLGMYLGRSNIGSTFGAAGSLALILVWVYYSSMILLLGAEFTQVWSNSRGQRILPSAGAVRVVKEKKRIREPSETIS